MIAHEQLAHGVVVTGVILDHAKPTSTYRDFSAEDGTARFDGVWGM